MRDEDVLRCALVDEGGILLGAVDDREAVGGFFVDELLLLAHGGGGGGGGSGGGGASLLFLAFVVLVKGLEVDEKIFLRQ